MPYRAGYTPAQRREIEARLVAGELRAVVTTDALELGIDVGALDAARRRHLPRARSRACARCGGAPGAAAAASALYVAGEDALDQFFARHPDDFLERPVESAILDHESEEIHLAHLLCAAHEGPLSERRRASSSARARSPTSSGSRASASCARATGASCCAARERYPAAEVSLRSASPDSLRDRRRHDRRGARHDRGGARLLDAAPGRDLPAPGPLATTSASSTSSAPRARRAVRRRLVHAAQARDRHADRAAARPPRGARRDALVRPRRGHRDRARLPAPAACATTARST